METKKFNEGDEVYASYLRKQSRRLASEFPEGGCGIILKYDFYHPNEGWVVQISSRVGKAKFAWESNLVIVKVNAEQDYETF